MLFKNEHRTNLGVSEVVLRGSWGCHHCKTDGTLFRMSLCHVLSCAIVSVAHNVFFNDIVHIIWTICYRYVVKCKHFSQISQAFSKTHAELDPLCRLISFNAGGTEVGRVRAETYRDQWAALAAGTTNQHGKKDQQCTGETIERLGKAAWFFFMLGENKHSLLSLNSLKLT